VTDSLAEPRRALDAKPFEITFPRGREEDRDQDEEFCEVVIDGDVRKIRFHDYDEIFAIPGLYEQLFYDELKCDSPRVVAGLLGEHIPESERSELRVLDVGAGNGMVGEELDKWDVHAITGVDIIQEAADATERDRPGIYERYYVVDLTDIPEGTQRQLEERPFNALTSVAALGFGDIPPEAFAAAYNFVDDGGMIAFNIRDRFMEGNDRSGFEEMMKNALDDGALEKVDEKLYRHRLAVSGEELMYWAIVARKRGDLKY
jgi:SAM-dependent methyltransferase